MLLSLCFVENMEEGDESKWEKTDLFKAGSEQVCSQVSILGEGHKRCPVRVNRIDAGWGMGSWLLFSGVLVCVCVLRQTV